jgi:hypothetical protein
MNADLYKISSKRNEKWWSWGNIKKGEKGFRGGIKKTPEFMAWVNETPDGGFLNFLLFEDKPNPNKKDAMQDGNTYEAAKSGGYDDSNSEIPF